MNARTYSKYFKAFGDPSRQKILVFICDGEKTVQEIADAVELSQPTVSRHLSILKEADTVTDRRDGQHVFYRLNKEAIRLCCMSFCGCLGVDDKVSKKKKKKSARTG